MLLIPKPLTAEAFAPYGEVISTETAKKEFSMNYGLATRYFDLAEVDVDEKGGKTCISLVNSNAVKYPFSVEKMVNDTTRLSMTLKEIREKISGRN